MPSGAIEVNSRDQSHLASVKRSQGNLMTNQNVRNFVVRRQPGADVTDESFVKVPIAQPVRCPLR